MVARVNGVGSAVLYVSTYIGGVYAESMLSRRIYHGILHTRSILHTRNGKVGHEQPTAHSAQLGVELAPLVPHVLLLAVRIQTFKQGCEGRLAINAPQDLARQRRHPRDHRLALHKGLHREGLRLLCSQHVQRVDGDVQNAWRQVGFHARCRDLGIGVATGVAISDGYGLVAIGAMGMRQINPVLPRVATHELREFCRRLPVERRKPASQRRERGGV